MNVRSGNCAEDMFSLSDFNGDILSIPHNFYIGRERYKMNRIQEEFLDLVRLLPEPEELLERAKIFAKIDDGAEFSENYNENGADRYYWEDGSGGEANIIFKADGKHIDSVLMFVYDHESEFNTYSESFLQIAFDSLPASIENLIAEDYLKWSWDKGSEEHVVYATAAIWREHGDAEWRFSPILFTAFAEEGEDGGFDYGFDRFTLPLEADAFIRFYEERGLRGEYDDIIRQILPN